MKPTYVGRFAPSPTGPLHFGSLVAAMGSYLQARSGDGRWLLRIEDIDPPREVKGAADSIINSLEKLGFEWDDPISWQSARLDRYQQAINQLATKDALFACICSRKQLAENADKPGIYPGTCRERVLQQEGNSLRLRVEGEIDFDDFVQGHCNESLPHSVGDFVIKRRDGLFAYQLAVVVDDAEQGVTEVVRGADLLDNTGRQIFLQQQLQLPTPHYCHLPIARDAHGNKLSKQTQANPVDDYSPINALLAAWEFLGQRGSVHQPDSIEAFWRWAINNWRLKSVPKERPQAVPSLLIRSD